MLLTQCDLHPTPGVLQADPGIIRDQVAIFRIFCHECQRVFHDRLINNEDKKYFNEIMAEMASKHFSQNVDPDTFVTKPIIFGDFMKMGAEEADRLYEDIVDLNKLRNVLGDVSLTSTGNFRLWIFHFKNLVTWSCNLVFSNPIPKIIIKFIFHHTIKSFQLMKCTAFHWSFYLCFILDSILFIPQPNKFEGVCNSRCEVGT